MRQMTRNSKQRIVPLLIMALGAVLMAAAWYRGEVRILFEKAVNICLECIGIG